MDKSAIQFEVHPSSGVPIYRQIMDQVRAMIVSGRLNGGELLPSVRQMAEDLQVNMMTVCIRWVLLVVMAQAHPLTLSTCVSMGMQQKTLG